jgi:ABC-2 type transport system permease protein
MRWTFNGTAEVNVAISVGMTLGFLAVCMTFIWWIFKTGYKLKS